MRIEIKIFFIVAALFFLSESLNAQKFKASVILGANAAQIDGDLLVGYHKLGLNGGLRVGYPIKEKTDIGLEMLFCQRGSRSPFGTDAAALSLTNLDYISIPLFINYKDWYIAEEQYYKVRVEGGLGYSYLFDVDSNDDLLEPGIGNFRRNDINIHLGLSYSLNKKWTFTTRWTRSLFYIWESSTIQNVDGLISYFLSFRFEYNI